MRTPITIGVVGLGSWGLSVARVLDELPQASLRYVHDRSPKAQLRLKSVFPAARVAASLGEILDDHTLDAVVLGTPSPTRYELARMILEADKHLLVRSPLALRGEEADELVRLAEARQRRVGVAYRFQFSPAMRKLRELLEGGDLGELFYVDVAHHASGSPGSDRNVLWDLGVEQVALISHLLGDEPVEVSARGESYAEPGIVDVAYCSLRFATGIWAHVHLSWLGPEDEYRLTAIGAEQAVVIDDGGHKRGFRICLKGGDLVLPRLQLEDPLRVACERFLKTVSARSYGYAAVREGARVVNAIEALQVSLELGGSAEKLGARADATVVPLRSR
jgi:predicted dehydrogenase